MPGKCPRCSQSLPEVETLEFRFCPHCGAEITPEPGQIEDAYLTIPPDPPPSPAEHRPMDLRPETEKKEPAPDRFNDRTEAPQAAANRQQLKLKPPKSPPPDGFFRNRSAEKPPLNRPAEAEKAPSTIDMKKQSPTGNRKTVIAILVILVIIILVLGALFSF